MSELVAAGKIVTTREDEGEPFLTVWRHHEKDASHPATSVRFAVIVNDASKFELILEGLPAEAGRLHGLPVLRKDNSAAVQLGRANLAHERDGAAEGGSIRAPPLLQLPGGVGAGGGGPSGRVLQGAQAGLESVLHSRDPGAGGCGDAGAVAHGGRGAPSLGAAEDTGGAEGAGAGTVFRSQAR